MVTAIFCYIMPCRMKKKRRHHELTARVYRGNQYGLTFCWFIHVFFTSPSDLLTVHRCTTSFQFVYGWAPQRIVKLQFSIAFHFVHEYDIRLIRAKKQRNYWPFGYWRTQRHLNHSLKDRKENKKKMASYTNSNGHSSKFCRVYIHNIIIIIYSM